MKIALYTLGCKVNQYETQALESELSARGHELVDFDTNADAYIINTCTVTAVSDKKSRQAIRRAQSHGAFVAVCGCYSQTNPEDIKKLGVDIIAGTGGRLAFLDLLESAVRGAREPIVSVDDALRRREFEILTRGGADSGLSSRTRAMLKVQDGCVNFCTYCIIPYARGPVRSMPLEQAVLESERLAAQGYRELVLTGIEISSYGADFGGSPNLTDLVRAVCAVSENMRVRLGSLEPRTVDERFCQSLCGIQNLCPQFHLSLQSGCDATLKRMGRKYNSTRYLESVRLLRQYFKNPAITTDLIVGFPGETEDEFTETLEFIEKCGFASMHIFPYSKRSGTPAAVMDGQLARAVRDERAARAAVICARMKREYLSGCVGDAASVLIEKSENGISSGHAGNYAEVHVSGAIPSGSMPDVLITGAGDDFLLGEVIRQ